MIKNIIKSEQEMCQKATKVAETLGENDIVLLTGPLGAGKSVFARALIQALTKNPKLEVPSPTFTLVQTYDLPNDPKGAQIWHFDLYRLENHEEIYELGWEEATDGNITLIEWPQRLGPLKPIGYLDIHIELIDNEPESRTITIESIS